MWFRSKEAHVQIGQASRSGFSFGGGSRKQTVARDGRDDATLPDTGIDPTAAEARIAEKASANLPLFDDVAVRGNTEGAGERTAAARGNRPDTIVQPEHVPEGTLVSAEGGVLEVAPERRELFAVIHAKASGYVVLVAEEAWGTSPMFTLQVRVKAEAGGEPVRLLPVARELLPIIYAASGDSRQNATRDERQTTSVEENAYELIAQALRAGASDVHIETRSTHARVMMRINGIRRRCESISFEDAKSIGRVLYNVHADASSKETAWNEKQVQDCAIERTIDGKKVQVRFNSAPIYPAGNFQIVLRILVMEQNDAMELEAMGFAVAQMNRIELMSTGSRGMVIVTGPTNSGKSTTLQAVLRRVHQMRGEGTKIVTVEDPVEYLIPGAVQMGVPGKAGESPDERRAQFNALLRGTLRQDPDVIMVGEVRDASSASTCTDLTLAGRKLFTTLHTSSALGAFVRLGEIGVDWTVVTSPDFIAGVLYQRLLPVLCPECRVDIRKVANELDGNLMRRVEQVARTGAVDVRVRGKGCEHCDDTGYVGRTAVAEVVIPDATLLKHLAARDFLAAEAHWRATGNLGVGSTPTALSHAIVKMNLGIVDPRDIESSLSSLTADILRNDEIQGEHQLSPKAELANKLRNSVAAQE